MKTIFTFIILCLSVTFVWAQKKSNKKPGFYLEYTSSTKIIIIKGDSIIVKEWIEEYDNPVSSMPSSRKEVIKKAYVNPAKIVELKILIKKKNGFMSLPKNEYGGSAADRFYPYTISATVDCIKKKVLYRSNPAPETEKAPEAFTELEKKVNELASEVK